MVENKRHGEWIIGHYAIIYRSYYLLRVSGNHFDNRYFTASEDKV